MIKDIDWIIEAASHADECLCATSDDCPGRFPDYSQCAVAELAADYLLLRKKAGETGDN